MIIVYSRWLRENESILLIYAIFQIILAFIMIITGGYLTNRIYSFETSFEKFGVNDNILYYSMIYYRGVA